MLKVGLSIEAAAAVWPFAAAAAAADWCQSGAAFYPEWAPAAPLPAQWSLPPETMEAVGQEEPTRGMSSGLRRLPDVGGGQK